MRPRTIAKIELVVQVVALFVVVVSIVAIGATLMFGSP
jgi:type IV secretory pathway VirB2 component (pilin)